MRSRLVALMLCTSILQTGELHRQSEIRASPGAVTLRVEFGFDADGGVTPQWLAALRSLRRAPTVPGQQFAPRTPSAEESSWAAFIEVRVAIWATMIDSLRIPFQAMSPPSCSAIRAAKMRSFTAMLPSASTLHASSASTARLASRRIGIASTAFSRTSSRTSCTKPGANGIRCSSTRRSRRRSGRV